MVNGKINKTKKNANDEQHVALINYIRIHTCNKQINSSGLKRFATLKFVYKIKKLVQRNDLLVAMYAVCTVIFTCLI